MYKPYVIKRTHSSTFWNCFKDFVSFPGVSGRQKTGENNLRTLKDLWEPR